MPRKIKTEEYFAEEQFYRGIRLKLIRRHDYHLKAAKRFVINGTNQNVWIPNKHLTEYGEILPNQDLDYVFRRSQRQMELAGYTQAIPGIKRRSVTS
ncbi:hypothetical protein [Lysinibacillus odysseyi]|uniref:hypothetical protein n=1 Tax=Lysinibacillus odysseyi TaxID=202611 RepID=UPI000691023E|nr:hypothetical protein [Lysinibacillus odysseyi]